jgi:nitroreductase
MLRDLILANRSYRRFHQEEPIAEAVLLQLVDLARLSASAGNLQQKSRLRRLFFCSL